MKGLSKVETREAVAHLKALLATGADEVQVAAELGVEWLDFEKLKATMYEHEAARTRKASTEDIYTDYRLAMASHQKRLLTMLDMATATGSKQFNAQVGAMKVLVDIEDRIVKMGQELRLIEKAPLRTESASTVLIAEMSTTDLRKAIANEVAGLEGMMDRYGEAAIVDVTPGPLHHGVHKTKALVKPHARARVHKGRRKVVGE